MRLSRNLPRRLFAIALLAAPLAGAHAATFSVGATSDAACSHHSLAAAISAADLNGSGMDTIRVATNMVHAGIAVAILDQSVTIAGGYANCADTSAAGRTVLTGSVTLDHPVLRAGGSDGVNFLVLENLDLVGAQDSTLGGALRLTGNQYVTAGNTRLRGGHAERGGAVYIDAFSEGAIDLRLDEGSSIENNVATYAGGGIYCRGNATVVLDDAFLTGNIAEHHGAIAVESGSGGGAALYDGCHLRQNTGVAGSNVAEQDGGAYYLRNDARLTLLGDGTHAALLNGNTAENGGAIAVEDVLGEPPSVVDVRNARINDNTANFQGGAIALLLGGELEMRRTLRGAACHSAVYCSDLSFNAAPGGRAGTLFVGHDATAVISGTWIEGSVGYVGSVLWLQSNGTAVFDSSVIRGASGAVAMFQLSNPMDSRLDIGWSTITGNIFANEVSDRIVSANGGAGASAEINLYGLVLGQHVRNAISSVDSGVIVHSDCIARDPYMQPIVGTRELQLDAPYGLAPNGRLAGGDALPADYCDASLAPRLYGDIDGDTEVDDAASGNVHGIHDLGADEYQVADLIFADGFEAGA